MACPEKCGNALYPRRLLAANPRSVAAFTCVVSFQDIGTPADYLDTSIALAAIEGDRMSRGRRQAIAPSARIVETAGVDDVTIGKDAVVQVHRRRRRPHSRRRALPPLRHGAGRHADGWRRRANRRRAAVMLLA